MRLYILPAGTPEALFEIQNSRAESELLTVCGGNPQMLLVNTPDGACVASIRRFCFFDFFFYDIRTVDGGKVSMMRSLSGGAPAFSVLRQNWKFRGDFVLRSFDLIGEDGSLLMTHGRAWERGPDCFAVDIRAHEGLLLLCTAIAVDSESQAGPAAMPTVH